MYIVGYFQNKSEMEEYIARLDASVNVKRLGKGKKRYIEFVSGVTPPRAVGLRQ